MIRDQASSRRRPQRSERQGGAPHRTAERRGSPRAARNQGASGMLRSAPSTVGRMLRGSTNTLKEAGATVIDTAREVITAASTARHDAVSVLKIQHREVEALFQKALESDEIRTRRELLHQIGDALALHTKIEEDIFYPAVRSLGGEKTQALI